MRTRRSQSSDNPAPVPGHRTVLLHEAVELMDIHEGDTVVDATLGGAGHSREILSKLGAKGHLVAFDADLEAIERARTIFGADKRVSLIHANFKNVREKLSEAGVAAVDKVLFDLGWSGFQLDAGRGFSFLSDESLSMAYDAGQTLTAATIVNEWDESSISDVLYGWGEERYSRRIAHAIAEARGKAAIKTSAELAAIVKAAVPTAYRFGRLHPATKTFQALRIAVNDELGALREGLLAAWHALARNGRIAVISFHSIEDRIVKQQFREWEDSGSGTRVTKKPLSPSAVEIQENPRSRSAKLRVIQKN
ncbi:16S rRNA (cytosine(1402)-N(4))-methyltransferase RsmH [Candidatus Kaiserbacteria bacterium]|nr:16S rRNA (cytosine(1402)-N(4))-methyltransferase RsmH [Candidatus Kaiserbacteria bacterium]